MKRGLFGLLLLFSFSAAAFGRLSAEDLPRFAFGDVVSGFDCAFHLALAAGRYVRNPRSQSLGLLRVWDLADWPESERERLYGAVENSVAFLELLDRNRGPQFLRWSKPEYEKFLLKAPSEISFENIPLYQVSKLGLSSFFNASGHEQASRLHVGTFGDLDQLLRLGQTPEPLVQQVMSEVSDLKEIGRSHPVLSGTLAAVREFPRHLFTCLLRNDCEFVSEDDGAIHTAVNTNLNFVSTPFAEAFSADSIRSIPICGMERALHAIMQKPLLSANRINFWIEGLFHELTHFADYLFLSAWIRANQMLIHRGESPDDLFTEFIRVDPDDKNQPRVFIYKPFWSVFLEGRAYSVSAYVLGHLFKGTLEPWLASSFSYTVAIEYLRSKTGGSQSPLGRWGISETNPASLPEKVSLWFNTMEDTVDRAK